MTVPAKVTKDPVLHFLDSKKDALLGAMPRSAAGITWESILQGVWLAMDKQPKLRQVHPRTIFASMLYILRLGLDPSGQTGEAYLVPFNNKKKGADGHWTEELVCTPMLGAYGKLRLAQRFGGVIGAPATDVVYEADLEAGTDWNAGGHFLIHKQAFGKPRGKPLFVYFRAWVKGGVDAEARAAGLADIQEIMSWDDFEKIKETAKKKNFGKLSPAYEHWPDEMAKRSCISRGTKKIDKAPDLLTLMADARGDFERASGTRHREMVVDESGTVVLEDEFTSQPRELSEDLPVEPLRPMEEREPVRVDTRTGEEVPKEAPASPNVVAVDPETGEIVPEPEELERTRSSVGRTPDPGLDSQGPARADVAGSSPAASTTTRKPTAKAQQKLGGMP